MLDYGALADLLEKAAETPEDETWRYVVGDWLLEHGLDDEAATVTGRLDVVDDDESYTASLNTCLRAVNAWLNDHDAGPTLEWYINRIRKGIRP